jgi:hypothetical protein
VSCSNFTEGKPAAEKAVINFHSLFNQQNFRSIYENTHEKFKKGVTEKEYTQLLETIHRKLGKETKTTNKSWYVKTHNLTTYVTLGQETTYENGKGIETFVYIINDSKAFLFNYNINSTDLIMK